jgi:hypothetical protein
VFNHEFPTDPIKLTNSVRAIGAVRADFRFYDLNGNLLYVNGDTEFGVSTLVPLPGRSQESFQYVRDVNLEDRVILDENDSTFQDIQILEINFDAALQYPQAGDGTDVNIIADFLPLTTTNTNSAVVNNIRDSLVCSIHRDANDNYDYIKMKAISTLSGTEQNISIRRFMSADQPSVNSNNVDNYPTEIEYSVDSGVN